MKFDGRTDERIYRDLLPWKLTYPLKNQWLENETVFWNGPFLVVTSIFVGGKNSSIDFPPKVGWSIMKITTLSWSEYEKCQKCPFCCFLIPVANSFHQSTIILLLNMQLRNTRTQISIRNVACFQTAVCKRVNKVFLFTNQHKISKQQTSKLLILPSEHVKKGQLLKGRSFWFPPSIPNSQFVRQPCRANPAMCQSWRNKVSIGA